MADPVKADGPAQQGGATTVPSSSHGGTRTVRISGPRRTLYESFRHRVRSKVLVLLCLMYLITYMDRVNISTAAPFIKEDLGLNNTKLGLALVLPVTLDDDDGVIEIDDAVRVAGWQGDVVLGSVT